MMYFAGAGEYSDIFDGGFAVTPSHNDSTWNGCKILSRNAEIVCGDFGFNELKSIILNGAYENSVNRGSLKRMDIYPAFKQKILSYITSENRIPLKIAFDAGNGLGGKVFDYILRILSLKLRGCILSRMVTSLIICQIRQKRKM